MRGGERLANGGVVFVELDEVDLAIGVDRGDPHDGPEASRPSDHHGADLDVGWVTGVARSDQFSPSPSSVFKSARSWIGGVTTAHLPDGGPAAVRLTIFQLLQARKSPHTVRAWFVGLNPQLDDESPATTIREGAFKDALVAARAFLTGPQQGARWQTAGLPAAGLWRVGRGDDLLSTATPVGADLGDTPDR